MIYDLRYSKYDTPLRFPAISSDNGKTEKGSVTWKVIVHVT